MSNNYFISCFGTFGNPHGFKQSYFFVDNAFENIKKAIKQFDLNTNAIKLFPNSKVYSIRKEYADNHNIISYSIYSFAKEQNSERGGTFIGCSLLYINDIADENITISCLNQFHDNLKSKYVQNDIIQVKHSDNFNIGEKPKDFDKIGFNLRPIEELNFTRSSNKISVVYCKITPDELQSFFKQAIDLLNVYDTIYFTNSNEVAEFVHSKRIFTLIKEENFKNEIQELQNERKQKIETSISFFENEIKRLNDYKNKTITDFSEQIQQNEKIHQENEQKIKESQKELQQITQNYDLFSNKIQDLSNQLKSGKKLEDVKKIYEENKRIFIDSVTHIKKPIFINKLKNPKPSTELRPQPEQTSVNYSSSTHRHSNNLSKYSEPKERFESGFRIETVILATLLCITVLGLLIYFMFSFSKDDQQKNTHSNQQAQVEPTIPTEKPKEKEEKIEEEKIEELTPTPNAELSENDYKAVAKSIEANMKIDEVVKIIFKKNPTDINKNYKGQEEIYEKQLLKKNKDCFEDRDGIYHFVNDTLRHIPSYKKE